MLYSFYPQFISVDPSLINIEHFKTLVILHFTMKVQYSITRENMVCEHKTIHGRSSECHNQITQPVLNTERKGNPSEQKLRNYE